MSTERTPELSRARSERLADLFTEMQRAFVLRLSKELARGQVTFPQYLLLGYLAIEPLTMTEIAQRMGHTTAATTGLVDRLERLGLAARIRDAADRRVFRVTISDAGRGLIARIRQDMIANILRLMSTLTPEEEEAWLRIYEKLHPLCQKN